MFKKSRGFTSRLMAAALTAALVMPAPAAAQFGGLFKKRSTTDGEAVERSANSDCASDPKSSIGKSILGKMIGDFTRRAAGGLGVAGSFIPRAEVADTLTEAIACQLDPDEQLQAAEATRSVTATEQIGTTSEWTSQTRPGVSGRSTATAKTLTADGTSCMTITDVVIVDGEESRISKQMCRNPGETRYIIVA
jgi:surface antigen